LKIKEVELLASSYDCLAGWYSKIRDKKKAINYHMKALKICDDLKKHARKTALLI
jgi:hypothetical protein